MMRSVATLHQSDDTPRPCPKEAERDNHRTVGDDLRQAGDVGVREIELSLEPGLGDQQPFADHRERRDAGEVKAVARLWSQRMIGFCPCTLVRKAQKPTTVVAKATTPVASGVGNRLRIVCVVRLATIRTL